MCSLIYFIVLIIVLTNIQCGLIKIQDIPIHDNIVMKIVVKEGNGTNNRIASLKIDLKENLPPPNPFHFGTNGKKIKAPENEQNDEEDFPPPYPYHSGFNSKHVKASEKKEDDEDDLPPTNHSKHIKEPKNEQNEEEDPPPLNPYYSGFNSEQVKASEKKENDEDNLSIQNPFYSLVNEKGPQVKDDSLPSPNPLHSDFSRTYGIGSKPLPEDGFIPEFSRRLWIGTNSCASGQVRKGPFCIGK